jgi:hypothetical protein
MGGPGMFEIVCLCLQITWTIGLMMINTQRREILRYERPMLATKDEIIVPAYRDGRQLGDMARAVDRLILVVCLKYYCLDGVGRF